MSEMPPEDDDQDAEPPVGAPAPDPGGEPANPADAAEGRVEQPGQEA